MNNSQIISDLYHYLIHNLPSESLDLIIENDIRVANFFTKNIGVYLKKLKAENSILSLDFQHTIILDNPKRAHIDIVFVDGLGTKTYLELKHFSISQKRGKRNLSFYTSNSKEGSKVGIVGDCKKFDDLENKGELDKKANQICCAFITPKPNKEDLEKMERKFATYPELENWSTYYPVGFETQNEKLGMITLEKNK